MIRLLRKLDLWLGSIFFGKRKKIKQNLKIADNLYMKHIRNGKVIEKRLLGHNLLVEDGMEFIVDAWQNSVELEIAKYHDTGIGTTGPTAGDTGMENATGFTRGTGTLAEGDNAREFQSVATISCTGTKAITEWGLFSALTSGILIARNTFAVINVVNGDSVQFTWECQLSAN